MVVRLELPGSLSFALWKSGSHTFALDASLRTLGLYAKKKGGFIVGHLHFARDFPSFSGDFAASQVFGISFLSYSVDPEETRYPKSHCLERACYGTPRRIHEGPITSSRRIGRGPSSKEKEYSRGSFLREGPPSVFARRYFYNGRKMQKVDTRGGGRGRLGVAIPIQMVGSPFRERDRLAARLSATTGRCHSAWETMNRPRSSLIMRCRNF